MESTANKSITTAAIDLGSNSFRLLIAKSTGDTFTVTFKQLETVRLGKGLSVSEEISPETINKGLEALSSFKDEINRRNVKSARCCGTQALRQASNSSVFIARAENLLGIKIEIIDGHEEAVLNCRGVVAGLGKNIPYPVMIIDVGGGSTEIAYLETHSSIPHTVSILLGAVTYSENAATGQASALLDQLAPALTGLQAETRANFGSTTLICSGGTATALAALDLALNHYDAEKVQGHFLGINRLYKIAGNISAMSLAERNQLPGLEQGRGDILLAGIEIYQEILATIEVEGMIISDYGILEGILLSSLEQ